MPTSESSVRTVVISHSGYGHTQRMAEAHIQIVRAEGLAMGPEKAEAAKSGALSEIAAL